MLEKKITTVAANVSGDTALTLSRGIAEYHRVPVSDGYRASAQFCADWLCARGIKAWLASYRADESTSFFSQRMFKTWNCDGARLTLETPGKAREVLADYVAEPLSIAQRSFSVDFKAGAQLMALPKGMSMKEFLQSHDAAQLRGKLVLVDGNPSAYEKLVSEHGALALVTDHVPEVFARGKFDKPDARAFFSFTRMDTENDPKAAAFVLTPRQGDKLRGLCDELAKKHAADAQTPRYPTLGGYIDARFADGETENVRALIPGKTEERVLVTAHLCHAKGCANDNASGCAAAMEALRAIAELIGDGTIERPKRGIELLLVPEVVGTFAFLAEDPEGLKNYKAAINLDMVGRKQENGRGLLGVIGLPDAAPSFVQDLHVHIIKALGKDVDTFNLDSAVSTVWVEFIKYMGGSDNYILCDPTVGVPCPGMMGWLDDNYHSTLDTAEGLDPRVLGRTASTAAAYLYALATLDTRDMPPIMGDTRARFAAALEAAGRDLPYMEAAQRVAYQLDVFSRATQDYLRFFDAEERAAAAELVEAEKRYLEESARSFCRHVCGGEMKPLEEEPSGADETVYERVVKGPITFVGFGQGLSAELSPQYAALTEKYPLFFGIHGLSDLVLHHIDGVNTTRRAALLAAVEGGVYDADFARDYLAFLAQAGIVARKR